MRKILKKITLFFSIIFVSPLIFCTIFGRLIGFESPVFVLISQGICIIPGIPGDYLRRAYYMYSLKRVGRDVVISFGSIFSKQDTELGDHVNIGDYCIIGNVKFGDHVLVASRVSLLSGKYQHGSALVPVTGCPFKGISIGNRTWIGEGAIVAADIGADCIVAAGSVVMRNVPDGYMAAGNPAKLIRKEVVGSTEQSAGETKLEPS